MAKIPERKPDFNFPYFGTHSIEGWQLEDHYVFRTFLSTGEEILLARSGQFKEQVLPEIRATISDSIARYFLGAHKRPTAKESAKILAEKLT